MQDLQQEPMCD